MGKKNRKLLVFAYGILQVALAIGSIVHAAPPLQRYNINSEEISVSGLSSGGYMAVQMHLAFSGTFMGAGVLAGGPYLCAEGDVARATGRCMSDETAFLPPASYFRDLTATEAIGGRIDPTSNLAGDRVWLFTGGADDVVLTRVMDRLKDYYEFYTDSENIAYKRDTLSDAQHAMITDDYGNSCSFKGDPFINDCDLDAAGILLQHIHGLLSSPVTAPTENLETFDQSAFSGNFNVGSEGYVYVPSACADSTVPCRLHVAFHGCKQNKDKLGDEYARHAGYNEWAEANNIIVLYPQTNLSAVNQCWDWWGFTDLGLDKKYHTRQGIHMAAVKAMIDHMASDGIPPNGYCDEDTNSAHVSAGRAYARTTWWMFTLYYAKGSDDYIGWRGGATTTLKETAPGHFKKVSECS